VTGVTRRGSDRRVGQTDVVRVHAFHLESDGAAAVLRGHRPDDPDAGDLAECAERVRGERLLASGYLCWLRQREWLMCPVLIGEAVLSEEQGVVKSRA